ncbi:chromosome segregation protein SMC [Selenomonas sp. TAMA-11512]|uniref:chromosome segregation protein SMC n=1 Tax=Selenomonas sp. TAMA-11512 TaxID=3095337 RepID=UPI0030857A2B|nr:chromosome segregation protein SMC [Selenomonas sp. TAMA-11512]
MRLKRLESYGFKSFADKTEIVFNEGITAIVGPNGSGKSNVTDAIRWVLGEQNIRNLRGTRAEDIIFTGSATRRALGVAEVSLYFDNDGTMPVDFKEVVITRRLYRSGESEFFINKARCRLKDISGLFADTGLGQDGMSVIGQNKIDEILNARPEERRLYFEETAGITKYRNRKREAVRKIEDMKGSLVRLGDIMREIDAQLGPLAESAEKTRRYNELHEDFRRAALTVLYHREEELHREKEDGEKDILAVRDREELARTELQLLEGEREELRHAVLELDRAMTEKAEAGNVLRTELEETGKEIATLEERSRQYDENRARLEKQREELASLEKETDIEIATFKGLKKDSEVRLEALVKTIAQNRTKSSELGEKLRAQKKAYKDLEEDKGAKERTLREKESELALLTQELSMTSSTDSSRQAELSEIGRALDALTAEKERVLKLLEEARAKESEQKALYDELQRESSGLREESDRLRQETNRLQAAVKTNENKLQFLTNMQSSYEGFGRAPKAILKAKERWSKGVCGAVAELLRVPSRYITAIDIALGSSVQNIVTEDTDTAKAAIGYLKERREGRVTFLPLSTIADRRSGDARVLDEEGVIGYANDLVQTDEKYRIVANFLLARTVVVDTLDHALALEQKRGWNLRAVTLEGELLNVGGSLSGGGRQHKETSFLNRSSEIEKLQSSLAEERAELETAERQGRELQESLQRNRNARHAAEERLQSCSIQHSTLELSLEHIDENYEEKSRQHQSLQERIQEAQQSFSKAKERQNRLQREQEEAKTRFHCAVEAWKNAEEELDDLEQDAEDLAAYINGMELEEVRRSQEKRSFEERILLKERERERIGKQQQDNQTAVSALEEEHATGADRLQELLETEGEQQERYNDNKRAADALHVEKLEKQDVSMQKEKAIRAASEKQRAAEAAVHKLELTAASVLTRLEQVQQEMLEKYGHTIETAVHDILAVEPEEAETRRKALERQMSALGTVNPNAIEAYEETKARYEHYRTQADDLEKAHENLLIVIRDMDNTMTEQFKKAFKEIQLHFDEIFVRLFGGGKAKLSLTDPKDVLHAGVEIDVQLPEKRQQNLSVLSGGERALTVIALLFAFLRYRPSPFSVLDEIDAPLDEANVVRFSNFLSEFAKDTQFIVVTHRKGTMESANYMYGITIEDAGVSKVISVYLDDVAKQEGR